MALTRKMLSAMGIEDEKIDQIITAHREVVDALKEEKDGFEADAKKVPGLEKQVTDLKKQIEKSGEGETETQKELDKVKKEFEDYKSGVAAKETAAKKKSLYSEKLKEAGISEKWIPKILRFADIDGLELTEDGKLKDEKIVDNIKTEYADYIVEQGKDGAPPAKPPKSEGGTDGTPSIATQMAMAHMSAKYGNKGE